MIKLNEFVKKYNNDTNVDLIAEHVFDFPFELDIFQKHAMNGISNDRNVLTCVGTGSGKTVVAIYAIAYFLKRNKRVIYTSPIKSLSNQKFAEFKEKFPDLGILTGDIRFNPDAQCLIMTTEILRNILFRKTESTNPNIVNLNIDDIGCVIFDEVHYINNPERGKVWEETIMMLPKQISLVMLSATIKNPEKFANWIGHIKQKPIDLIVKIERVIPLTHYYFFDNRMINCLQKDNKKNNNNKNNNKNNNLYNKFSDDRLIEILSSTNKFNKKNYDTVRYVYDNMISGRKYNNCISIFNDLAKYLQNNNLLPALFFCFSRRNCEKYAHNITINLVDKKQINHIDKIFNNKIHSLNTNYKHMQQYEMVYNLALKGIAVHHSGLVPVFKEIIEILFSLGLIKVLFATETFAVGVNMPTKTVVFTELKKYDGIIEKMRILRTDEYQQMAGRAGRRGLDTVGTVIHIGMRGYVPTGQMVGMMTGSMPEIISKFCINHQFILKVINFKEDSQSIIDFIKYSLMESENCDDLKMFEQKKKNLKEQIEEIQNDLDLSSKEREDIKYYIKITDMINSKSNIKRKKYKEYMTDIDNFKNNPQFMDKLNLYNKLQQNKEELNEIKDNIQFRIKETLQLILSIVDFLRDYGFLSYSNDNIIQEIEYEDGIPEDIQLTDDQKLHLVKKNITLKGLVAIEMNECNELVFSEMMYQHLLDTLTPEQIVAVVATFIDTRTSVAINSFEEINIPDVAIDVLYEIKDIVKKLSDAEYNYWIDVNTDWKLHMKFIEPAYMWACGDSLNKIYEITDIYEGNFIRSIIKINNICQNILNICELVGNDILKKKIEQIEPLLLRDIVSVESLYI